MSFVRFLICSSDGATFFLWRKKMKTDRDQNLVALLISSKINFACRRRLNFVSREKCFTRSDDCTIGTGRAPPRYWPMSSVASVATLERRARTRDANLPWPMREPMVYISPWKTMGYTQAFLQKAKFQICTSVFSNLCPLSIFVLFHFRTLASLRNLFRVVIVL